MDTEDPLGGLKPIVGQGHPLSPDRHKVLSADDEKRVDEKGVSIADGKLWSGSSTGMYLVIGLSTVPMVADKIQVGRTEIDIGPAFGQAGFKFTVSLSPYGKPSFMGPVVGACLELPDDLGSDKLKRQYVIEWIVNTCIEAMQDRKMDLRKLPKQTIEDFMLAVAQASETAIVASKL